MWQVNRRSLSTVKWHDICNSNHFFVSLLNMIAKMLNPFFGELYLIVNVNSKMLNLAASALRKKKSYLRSMFMLIMLFKMLHTENVSRQLRSAPLFPWINVAGYWNFFLLCSTTKNRNRYNLNTSRHDTKIIPAIYMRISFIWCWECDCLTSRITHN